MDGGAIMRIRSRQGQAVHAPLRRASIWSQYAPGETDLGLVAARLAPDGSFLDATNLQVAKADGNQDAMNPLPARDDEAGTPGSRRWPVPDRLPSHGLPTDENAVSDLLCRPAAGLGHDLREGPFCAQAR